MLKLFPIFALLRKKNMSNKENTTMSKRFFLKGDTANWEALGVLAINVKNGNAETTTTIPTDKVLSVTFVEGYDKSAPWTARHAVTAEASALAYRKANHGRNFLLVRDGVFVGWATFHRKSRDFEVAVTTTVTGVFTINAKSAEEAERIAKAKLEEIVLNSEIPSVEVDDTCADARENGDYDLDW